MKNQSGNVLFYILIAVALLAALSFAVTHSTRGSDSLSAEKTKVYAAEILEYANVVANAVGQLRLRGCSNEQISFENAVVAGYTNASAPSDKSCHVFDIKGGGVTFQTPSAEALVQTAAAPLRNFGNQDEIQDVGTTCGAATCTEFLFFTNHIKPEVCLKINEMLGVANIGSSLPSGDGDFTFAVGTSFSNVIGNTDIPEIKGKSAACIDSNSNDMNIFYKVLIAR